jgi:hypothetical protein
MDIVDTPEKGRFCYLDDVLIFQCHGRSRAEPGGCQGSILARNHAVIVQDKLRQKVIDRHIETIGEAGKPEIVVDGLVHGHDHDSLKG